MIIDFKQQHPKRRYQLMSQAIIPRPIAWIATEANVVNIAPFSYFSPLSSEPPALIVSIGHKEDGSPKDTLRNLRETKKCAVCIVDEVHFKAMHLSSKSLSANISEIEVFNIDIQRPLEEFPPVPKDIKVAFFCRYLQEIDLKNSKTIPVVLEIEHLYLNEIILSDKERIEFEFLGIARVGHGYATLKEDIVPPLIP